MTSTGGNGRMGRRIGRKPGAPNVAADPAAQLRGAETDEGIIGM